MEEIRLTSWYGKYPIIYMVLYIPGGCLGSLNHRQKESQLHFFLGFEAFPWVSEEEQNHHHWDTTELLGMLPHPLTVASFLLGVLDLEFMPGKCPEPWHFISDYKKHIVAKPSFLSESKGEKRDP